MKGSKKPSARTSRAFWLVPPWANRQPLPAAAGEVGRQMLMEGAAASGLLPSQVHRGSRISRQPEAQLMLAVLEDAFVCFMRYVFSTDKDGVREFRDAEWWIFNNDRAWPFSFLNICDFLDFDPEYWRGGLERWLHKAGEAAMGRWAPRWRSTHAGKGRNMCSTR